MTRAFHQVAHCPRCSEELTIETGFSRWVREHPELLSGDGYVAADHDLVWHKYRTELGRDFQLMMRIEVKTHGAEMSPSQRDTLHIENQLLRNRRQTSTKELRWQAGTTYLWVDSALRGCKVWIRHYGVHSLRFSQTGPDDSEWIKWDERDIDEPSLLSLLKFDLDPDTLAPMDFRSHHRKATNLMQRMLPLLRR